MKKSAKTASVVLAMAMVMTMTPLTNTQASARKTTISKILTSIPVGETGKREGYRTKEGGSLYSDNQVKLKHKNRKARYTYKSSNNSVLKVTSSGYMTGVKAGTAKLSVYQTLSGKTTLVGTRKITVRDSSFYVNSDADTTYTIGDGSSYSPKVHISELEKDQGGIPIGDSLVYGNVMGLLYRNPKASYSFNTGSEDLTIKMVKKNNKLYDPYDYYNYDAYEVNAKKAGDYNVEVTETYKGKTRSLGTYTVTVYNTEATQLDDSPVYEGQTLLAQSLFKHYNSNYDTLQITDGADKAEIHKTVEGQNAACVAYAFTDYPNGFTDKIYLADDMPYDQWEADLVNFGEYGGLSFVDYVTFKDAGTVTIKCTGKNGEDYGSVSVNVTENTITSMDLSFDYTELDNEYYIDDDYTAFESGQGITLYPDQTENVTAVFTGTGDPIIPPVDTGSISMVSDNTKVASIEYKPYDDSDEKCWVLTAKKPGYAHITVTYGDFNKKFDVFVSAD